MGLSMARNIARGGVPIRVFNRTRERAELLRNECPELVTVAGSLAEMALHTENVCMCVSNDAALEEVLFGEHGLLSTQGRIRRIIDFSTVSPATAKRVSERLQSKGISFLDAPVTGGDVGARNGTLTIMVGGDESELEALKPVLSFMGSRVVHMGPSGAGQLTKCVNQLACAVSIAAMSEGLAFAQNAGLELVKVIDVIGRGAAGSWALTNYAPRLLAGDLNPGFSILNQLKDLNIVADETANMPTPFPLLAVVRDLYRSLCADGASELGNHALIKAYRVSLS